MNQATISVASDSGAVQIGGNLTFQTVSRLSEQGSDLFQANAVSREMDLSAVEHVDSSGLALILEWQARATKSGNALRILHAPLDLIKLARLCEAQELLQLGSRTSPVPDAQINSDRHDSR